MQHLGNILFPNTPENVTVQQHPSGVSAD